jgi:hypothetical protein
VRVVTTTDIWTMTPVAVINRISSQRIGNRNGNNSANPKPTQKLLEGGQHGWHLRYFRKTS